MLLLAATVAALVLAQAPPQQSPAAPSGNGAQIQFAFDNPRLDPSSYTLVFFENGTGHFKSTPGPTSGDPQGVMPQPVDRDIQIGEPLRSQVFQLARAKRYFDLTCEAPNSHVAFTGHKTLSYSGPDGQGSCTFNYSRDPQLNDLASQMIAVAYTLEEGRRLAVELAHSRLGLDAELESLQDAVKDRQAIEIENIAPILQAIAGDEKVMNRARNRAQSLLVGGTQKH